MGNVILLGAPEEGLLKVWVAVLLVLSGLLVLPGLQLGRAGQAPGDPNEQRSEEVVCDPCVLTSR